MIGNHDSVYFVCKSVLANSMESKRGENGVIVSECFALEELCDARLRLCRLWPRLGPSTYSCHLTATHPVHDLRHKAVNLLLIIII